MLEKKIKRKVNLRVEKSLYPEGENTHILVLESSTEHGWNFEGIFKGTKKECIEKKKELEENNEPKRKNFRIFRKKSNNNNTRKCNATGNN